MGDQQADGARVFEDADNTELGYEAVWIPIFAIPTALAWWQEWTVAMWIFAGLTVFAVAAFALAFAERNDTKWRATTSFDRWPLPLGGPSVVTVNLEALQTARGDAGHADTNGPISIEVTLTCEERFEETVSRTRVEQGDSGEKESEVVVDRTETFEAHMVDGSAAIDIPLVIPIDRGGPTQKTKAANLTYEVQWNATVRVAQLDRTILDEAIPVATVWSGEEQTSHD